MSSTPPDMAGKKIEFGQFKGEAWARLPISYLKALTRDNGIHKAAKFAIAELNRRGEKVEEEYIEVTRHALNRATSQCLDIFIKTRYNKEGAYAWCTRLFEEALSKGKNQEAGITSIRGVEFRYNIQPLFMEIVTIVKL